VGRAVPGQVKLWRTASSEFIPFLDYGACRRFASQGGASIAGRRTTLIRRALAATAFRPGSRPRFRQFGTPVRHPISHHASGRSGIPTSSRDRSRLTATIQGGTRPPVIACITSSFVPIIALRMED
jgi:hypothetical protein